MFSMRLGLLGMVLMGAPALLAAGGNGGGGGAPAPRAGELGAWPGQVVVKFKETISERTASQLCSRLGLRWRNRAWNGDFDVVSVPRGIETQCVELLERLPDVEFAEPDYVCVATGLPTDPRYPNQWNMYDKGRPSGNQVSDYGVQGEAAWAAGAEGKGVIVAVLDTGVAFKDVFHDKTQYKLAPDLKGVNFVDPRRFNLSGGGNDAHAYDVHGHGTHVTGTIAAQADNKETSAGLARAVSIMPVKVLNNAGSGSVSSVAQGISWAVNHGAFVLNMSLVFTQHSKALSAACNDAWKKGSVIVAAAGNDGLNRLYFPAAYEKVIGVGATDFVGARTGYSNFGVDLDVVAPGGDVAVDLNQDGENDGIVQQTVKPGDPSQFEDAFYEGTSMATPHVAACAALVKGKHAAKTNQEVRDAIENTCRDLGAAGRDDDFGFGLIDCAAAIQ